MKIELPKVLATIHWRLTFESAFTLAWWGVAAVLVTLLLADLLIFYAYGWIPSVAVPVEVGRPVPSVAEADLTFAREFLQKRRQAFESSLAAPVTVPNPFR